MNDDEHSQGKAIMGLILIIGMGLYFLGMVLFT